MGLARARVVALLAVGVLGCAGPSREPIRAESVLAQVEALPAPRVPGTAEHRATQAHLERLLRQWGWDVELQPFFWPSSPDLSFVNLVARRLGERPHGPVVVLCAHYDTVPGSPGADDNGSGVAVLLEVARRLSARRLPAEIQLHLLDGEELGLYGSRILTRDLRPLERSRIVGVINLESVGYASRRPASQRQPQGTEGLLDFGTVGDFVLVLANTSSAALAVQVDLALRAEGGDHLRVLRFDRLPGTGWLLPDSRRSDHASYWDIGVPAVMVTDTAPFRNPHYHRSGDRPDTLDGAMLAAVARGVERAVFALAAGALE